MYKVAIIGCGNVARVHALALTHIPEVRIVSFCDIIEEKAKEYSSLYTGGSAKTYADYKEMLTCEPLDCVHICTPHYLHVPMAVAALKCGVHLFMEKPAAILADEFRLLESEIEKSGLTAGFCFQNRYNETTKYIDKLVSSGELGAILGGRAMVTWRRDEDYYQDLWHGKLALEGGGVLINQAIHTLDLLLRYLGTPLSVMANMSNYHLQGVTEVEDTLDAFFTFPGGQRASFFATTAYACDAPVFLELSFKKGRITLNGSDLLLTKENGETALVISAATASPGKAYWGAGHETCIADFYRCLTSSERYQNDFDGIRSTMETTLKIYEYIRNRR